LSASIALEVSAFLTANVPPKPQHSSRAAARELEAAHAPEQRSGASPTRVTRSEWQVG
jgi:hypothetical protein